MPYQDYIIKEGKFIGKFDEIVKIQRSMEFS